MTTTKAAPKKPARKTASSSPAKKTAGARTPRATKTPAKKSAKGKAKAATKKTAARTYVNPRGEKSALGYVIGSALNDAAEAVVEGGTSRQEVLDRLRDTKPSTTANGTERNWSVAVSTVIAQLVANGATIEQQWRVVPAEEVATAAPAKKPRASRAKAAAKDSAATETAEPAKRTRPARKKAAPASA